MCVVLWNKPNIQMDAYIYIYIHIFMCTCIYLLIYDDSCWLISFLLFWLLISIGPTFWSQMVCTIHWCLPSQSWRFDAFWVCLFIPLCERDTGLEIPRVYMISGIIELCHHCVVGFLFLCLCYHRVLAVSQRICGGFSQLPHFGDHGLIGWYSLCKLSSMSTCIRYQFVVEPLSYIYIYIHVYIYIYMYMCVCACIRTHIFMCDTCAYSHFTFQISSHHSICPIISPKAYLMGDIQA